MAGTERRVVRLVAFTDEHEEPFTETLKDPLVLRFTGTPVPVPEGWVTTWRKKFESPDRQNFAIVDGEDRFVGFAVIFGIDREAQQAELGYTISPWARGSGGATSALRQLTDHAFADGIVRATLMISVDNPASARVAEKAGYMLEGVHRSVATKNGERGDMQFWSRLVTDPDLAPPPE